MRGHRWSGAIAVLAMSIGWATATAQSPSDPEVDFAVTPSRLELRTPPGGRVEVEIKVFNRDTDDLILDAYVDDIEFPPHELIAPGELAFTASRWVTFATDELTVPAGSSAAITLIADVPAGTPSGGYHAFGFLQSRPEQTATGLLPSGRVGVTLLLEVAPDGVELDRSIRVSDSGLDVRWSGPFDADVDAYTIVENVGDSHVVTGGVHTYRSWPGAGGADVKIGPDTTLRGSRHTFESSWDSVPLFGKVTVTSEIVYQVGPNELPVIVTQHTVWVIPWHLIFAAVTLIGAAMLLIRRRRRAATPSDHQSERDDHEDPTEAFAATS